jgi:acyl-CoA thioester hydrolase
MKSHETRLRVRYAETDQMGVAYYANYLVWMELGRVEYCRAAGLRYRDMERDDGVLLAVAEASCRYLAPARYDDEIIVKTWVERAHSRMVQFAYELRRADDGRLIATGYTKHVFCDQEMRSCRMPAKYRPLFGLAA